MSEKIYAVVYRNYAPTNVDRLYYDQNEAEARADALGGMWRVDEIGIIGSRVPDPRVERLEADVAKFRAVVRQCLNAFDQIANGNSVDALAWAEICEEALK